MSGLFNIFHESTSSNSLSLNKGKEKAFTLATSKAASFGSAGLPSSKVFAGQQSKPRGLSIRSKSDLNIATNFGNTKTTSKDCLKLLGKLNLPKQSSSPIKFKSPTRKSCDKVTAKKLSPKISSPIMQNVIDEFIFKKPATPKQPEKLRCPEPEKLHGDFDHYKYMMEEIKDMLNQDRKWLASARQDENSEKENDNAIFQDDEGFISDAESEIETKNETSEENLISFELPEISDDED